MLSKPKIVKSCNDPIEEYLENFSKLTFKSDEYNSKSSTIVDIILGFLFHFLFLMIFTIFHLQNSASNDIECKTTATIYWVKIIITYHMGGAFSCLIFVPLGNAVKIIFAGFASYINYLTSFSRVMLSIASLTIFLLICSEYDWENGCHALNELLHVYILLSGTCYCLFIFLGACLFFANLLEKKENCNKSFLNLSKSIDP